MINSTLIRLQAARRNYEIAAANCVHWDLESDGGAPHECCHDLHDAGKELSAARKAAKQEQSK